MKITDIPQELLDVATKFAEQHAPKGYSAHGIRVCDVCGHMEWVTSHNQGTGVHILWASDSIDRHCRACLEVTMRAPEVARWVRQVVYMLELRLKGKT